jgi:RNA polymerase sigma-70 factor (ECF subfamily)
MATAEPIDGGRRPEARFSGRRALGATRALLGTAGGARHPAGLRTLDAERLGDHLERLYSAAWALCGSREDAEDLVQETYARVLARPRLVRAEDDLGYLLVALRNTFLDRKRAEGSRPRHAAVPEGLDLVETRTSRDPEAAYEAGEVFSAVSSLPAEFRDVLVAVDVVGLSYLEASRSLRIPQGTVMSRLYRARRQVARTVGR